jgi:prolyl oligopeptidase
VIKYASGDFLANSSKDIVYSKLKSDDVHDPENALNTKFMLHTIGTNVNMDKVVLSKAKYPELNFESSDYPAVGTYDHSPVMLAVKGNVNSNMESFYASLSSIKNDKIKWKTFSKYADEIKNVIPRGNSVYCLTSKGNENYRIIKVELPDINFSSAKEIASGDKDWKIDGISESKNYMVIAMSKNGLEFKNLRYNFETGKKDEINLPLKGTILIRPFDSNTNECVVVNTGWTDPVNFYKYNLAENQFTKGPFYTSANYPGINNLETIEVEVPSYDGTMVPLSIIYDKTKLKKDGSNICLLEGYGAYGMLVPIQPHFEFSLLPLLQRGVVYAWAHVRGGGEKGEAWHMAGFKTTKPNTWKDFNACAEYLINKKYTSSNKLGCSSASAGGILIGRAITERPDLYKVAIPKVGVLNAIRLETSPNGPVNVPEFGTVKDSVEAMALLEMDALHHVKDGTSYPALFITTGFNDPRVDSWEPGKFAAAMQKANNPETPTLLYVNYKGGHFGGTTVNEQYAEKAMEYAFLLWQCGDPEFQPKK